MLTSGLSRKQVAADLGVGHSTLNKWVKAFGHAGTAPQKEVELVQEIDRLRCELKTVTEGREILKHGARNLNRGIRYGAWLRFIFLGRLGHVGTFARCASYSTSAFDK